MVPTLILDPRVRGTVATSLDYISMASHKANSYSQRTLGDSLSKSRWMREVRISSLRRQRRRRDDQVLDFLVEKSLSGQDWRGRLLRLVNVISIPLERHYHIQVRYVTLTNGTVQQDQVILLALIVFWKMMELDSTWPLAMLSPRMNSIKRLVILWPWSSPLPQLFLAAAFGFLMSYENCRWVWSPFLT